MGSAVITLMTVVHGTYVRGAAVLVQYLLDSRYLLREFSGVLAVGTFVGLFTAQYLYLATPSRHFQILDEFTSSPSRGRWWRNVLLLIWFIGGATFASVAFHYRDQG